MVDHRNSTSRNCILQKKVWQSKELKGCVPSSFSYACIDSLALQFDLVGADYHFI